MICVDPLSPSDVARVVEIHLGAMPYSLNARLGGAHLAYLYSRMATLPGCLTAVARHDGAVTGAVTATLDPDQLSRILKQGMSIRLVLGALWKLVGRPWLLRDLWESSRLSRPVVHEGRQIRACLTAIVVDARSRQQGVGRALVHEVDAFVRNNGLRAYRLDTRLENRAARDFYARLGFMEAGCVGRNVILMRDLDVASL